MVIPYKCCFFTLLIVTTLLRLIFIGLIDISPDEAYYWNWSRHLDLSYYDHPPAVAYIIYLTTFFGAFKTELLVRLGAVIMGGGMTLIVYLLGKDIYQSEAAGFWSAVWLNLALMFSLGASIITPDTPQAFFSLLFLYTFYRAVFRNIGSAYYLAGLFLGLALLSKYTSFLLFPTGLLFLLLSPKYRHLLLDKRIYFMACIGLLVFSPVVLWNYNNDWISFGFQFAHGFQGKSRDPIKSMLELTGTQALLLTPFIFISSLFAIYYSFYYAFKKGDERQRFLFCTSAPILLFFLLVSAVSKIEGNWPSTGYLTLLVALGGLTVNYRSFFSSRFKINSWRLLKGTSVVTAIILISAVHLLALSPPVLLLKNTSFTKRLVGWRDLGERMDQLMLKPENRGSFVFANRHQVSSELFFYTNGGYEIYQIGGFGRYPYLKNMNTLTGKDALYVTEKDQNESNHVSAFFEKIEELDPLIIKKDGVVVRVFQIYKCYGYKKDLINT